MTKAFISAVLTAGFLTILGYFALVGLIGWGGNTLIIVALIMGTIWILLRR
jgi:hypothetical protein